MLNLALDFIIRCRQADTLRVECNQEWLESTLAFPTLTPKYSIMTCKVWGSPVRSWTGQLEPAKDWQEHSKNQCYSRVNWPGPDANERRMSLTSLESWVHQRRRQSRETMSRGEIIWPKNPTAKWGKPDSRDIFMRGCSIIADVHMNDWTQSEDGCDIADSTPSFIDSHSETINKITRWGTLMSWWSRGILAQARSTLTWRGYPQAQFLVAATQEEWAEQHLSVSLICKAKWNVLRHRFRKWHQNCAYFKHKHQ